ncbi:MAG: uracil-DNA glycosylase [Chloroflexi bacterium]|nr:uracil-DNA glycosylase [Chloroflexota bacterium]
MTSPASRAEDLYERIRGCDLCPLAKTRTHAVPGEGPLDAEVMFIGEAPGQNEDRQGRPFVGAAGQFLDELLAAAGFRRSEVYICNVLKCRPPANRDPLPGEIEACRDYLDEQIDLINPDVIVTLGRFSMARWFAGQAISRIHGKIEEIDGRFYVPMYHPAAALHQQALRETILADFRRLPEILARARARHAREMTAPAGLAPQLPFDSRPQAVAAPVPPTAEPPPSAPAGQPRLF